MTNKDQKNKLLYRSIHRGCKETDFLLGRYGSAKIADMNQEKVDLFDNLLNEDDMLIYDWILSKKDYPDEYNDIILDIQKFHKL